jgi:hypothetical protein
MSKIKKLNIEEKLPIISSLINNKEPDIKPNIITIYSISKCFNVSYIEAIILLNQFVLNESDLSEYAIFFLCETIDDSGTCFSKKIISSCDPNVNQILEDKKHTLNYGVFGICNINEYYLMENYRPFIGENDIITRFDFSDVPKNNFSSLNEPIDNSKKKESQNNEKKEKKALTKKEKDNKKITKKENNIKEKEEENYFGNFNPAKRPKTDKDKIHLGVGEKIKRKRNNDDKSEEEEKHHKKNRKEFSEDEDEHKKGSHSEINLGAIKEENKDEDVQMKDCNEEESKNEPKKVKKIRKVKKTKTFFNEEGYMVTKDVESEEEYWSDEKPEKKVVKKNHIQESKPNKNKKKTNKGQTTLNSFFI